MILIVILASCIGLSHSSGWSYNLSAPDGPLNWQQTYPTCAGMRQSPIEIENVNAQRVSTFPPWNLDNYVLKPGVTFTLLNNGHTAEVMVENSPFNITGGGLAATYTLEQLHFHWGGTKTRGSEHHLNGKVYPLELHLVHYNSDKYKSVSEATQDPSGLAVLGVLVQSAPSTTAQLQALTAHFPQIEHSGDQVEIDPFEVMTLLPTNSNQFYRYAGSLTTPSCAECVTWTIFYSAIDIADAELAAFQGLKENIAGKPDEALVDNFRPTQALNGRIVYKSST